MGHVGRPELHSGVVTPAGDELGVHQVEIHRPASLLVFIPHGGLGVGGAVPHYHGALVVAAGQHGFVEAAPGDAGDLAGADHLCSGVVYVNHLLQYNVVIVDLNSLRHSGNGKELLIFVELDAGDDGAVVEHVRGVGERGEGPDSVVASQTGQTTPELLQAAPAVLRPLRLRLLWLRLGEEEVLDPVVGVAAHQVPPVMVHPLTPPGQRTLLATEDRLVR